MSLHMASTLVYPLPDGVDFMGQEPANQARLKEWFGTLPTGAFIRVPELRPYARMVQKLRGPSRVGAKQLCLSAEI